MSEDPKSAPGETDDAIASEAEAEDRKAILARRNRFVAAALAGLAGASLVAACGGEVTSGFDAGNPQPCLKPRVEPEDASSDANDAAPQPCLTPIRPDAGEDASDGALPQPCLAPLPPDAGGD